MIDRFFARYPFHPDAKELIKDVQITEDIIKMGYARIKNSLTSRHWESRWTDQDVVDEVASYAASRMLLAYVNNPWITQKNAVAESKRVFHYLSTETDDNLLRLEQAFRIHTKPEWWMDLISFVKYAPRDKHYRLINRVLDKGWVMIWHNDPHHPQERRRILAEAVKYHALSLSKRPKKSEVLDHYAEKLLALRPKPKIVVSVKKHDHPPCIQAIIKSLQRHENVGHYGRWLLAVYLVKKGFSVDEIVQIFSDAPDFSERTTRYQVEFVMKKEYNVPSCDKVALYGYCVSNCGVKNPLSWRKEDGSKRQNDGSKSD